MSKAVKEMEMETLRGTFANVRDLVVLSISKLPAQAEYNLRATLRKKKIRVQMVKNTLTRRVFRELGLNIPDSSPYWSGPTALVWGEGSIAEVSRELDGELKGLKTAPLYKEKVNVKGAVADGEPISYEQALKMPTRLEAIGQILSAILAPAGAVAACLTGPAAQVASQVKTLAEKEEEGGEQASPEQAAEQPAG